MSDVYKTYRNNSGETLKIVYAENCDSPLEDSDCLFNYYTWLSRHRSIHPNEFHSAPEFIDFQLVRVHLIGIELIVYIKRWV